MAVDYVSLANLPPLNISVNYLIRAPYSTSANETLKIQTINWVQNMLLVLLNGTVTADPIITFTNNGSWTYTTAYFIINSTNLLNETTALNNLMKTRGNAGFSIVPDTLTVQGQKLPFNIINLSLRILNISPSSDMTVTSSSAFQTRAKAIEDSFKDIFGQPPQDVEPFVYQFTNDPLSVTASVNLNFQNSSIDKPLVVKNTINKEAIFRSRDIVLDLYFLDPNAVVQVTFTLIQDYTTSLSNISSSDAVTLQNSLLDLITPNLQKSYNNSLQTPPTVTFKFCIAYVSTSLEVFKFYPRFSNIAFTSDLNDRNSQRFKELEQNITRGFTSILTNNKLAQIVVASFSPGSVIGNLEMSFPQSFTTSSAVAQQIVNNKNLLQDINLTLDPQSVSLFSDQTAATIAPDQGHFPGYAVAIIVMCILAILCIPLFIYLALKTDLCQKLCRACSLKPPYEQFERVNVMSGLASYKTHSYDLPQ
ncbi:uncharacterized protein [Pyxicephalus adspersus]|uniref:uncharacterized protein n=1 Tax=Pyxicephalus adspersus TaxID=30357 RepID=UPI003B5BB331